MSSLKEYGELFQSLGLTELSVTEGDFSLTLKKENPAQVVNMAPPAPIAAPVPAQAPLAPPAPAAAPAPAGEVTGQANGASDTVADTLPANYERVKAPLLGVLSLGEGSGRIKVGDSVKKGDVLCSIEAMKMFNDVVSPVDGIIREICAKDGDLVEYGTVLFLIAK